MVPGAGRVHTTTLCPTVTVGAVAASVTTRLSFVCFTCDGHEASDVTASVRSSGVEATTVPVSLSVNGLPEGGAGASNCAAFFRYGNGATALPPLGCTSKCRCG